MNIFIFCSKEKVARETICIETKKKIEKMINR